MKLLILNNARSGRGQGGVGAAKIAGQLTADRHDVRLVPVGPGTDQAVVAAEIGRAEALIVAGGDGTLHHAVEHAIRAGTPVYHLPWGNENLFAREFGMDRRMGTLRRALAAPRSIRVDIIRATPEPGGHVSPVLLMASFGPDAHAIHRLHASRTRASGHLAYLGPTVREAISPSFPRLSVDLDGRTLFEGRRGLLLIANCRQYGLRTNPAAKARMDDGRLDVVFLPGSTTVAALWWALLSRLRLQHHRRSLIWGRGREARVRDASGDGLICQVDGEAAFLACSRPPAAVVFRVEPGVLPVLAP